MTRFSVKTVIVTGAASDIGLACARAFTAAGAAVVLADIDEAKAADAPRGSGAARRIPEERIRLLFD